MSAFFRRRRGHRRWCHAHGALAILVALSLNLLPGFLEARVVLDEGQQAYDVLSLDILEDPQGALSREGAMASEAWHPYASRLGLPPNFGFSRSVYWVRMAVENRSARADWLLQVTYPSLDRIDLYMMDSAGLTQSTAGDSLPFYQRPVLHQSFLFRVRIPPGEARMLLLRFQTEGSHQYPIRILSQEAFWHADRLASLAHGVYFGIILILGVYNLVLFFMVWDRSFLYYFLYITGFGLILLILDGLAFEWLWPTFPWWQNRSLPFTIGWSFFWSLAFASKFLNTGHLSVPLHRMMRLLMGGMVLLAASSLVIPYFWSIHASAVLVISFSIVVLIASLHSVSRGFRPARYFLFAWGTLLIGVAVYSLKGLGVLPPHFLTDYSLQIGSAVEMSLLSLGLGDRMQTLQVDRERALGAASESRRLFQEAELRSSRLELELLKKNIEPHFLMNTLNATLFLLQEDPATAAALLGSLAAELRILLNVSGRPLISIEEEVELCRRHLIVMGMRHEARYEMELSGSMEGIKVPPLILHTLIENGITHGLQHRGFGVFRLQLRQTDGMVEIDLENDGMSGSSSREGGLGFRYISARLEEAYPGRWTFRSEPLPLKRGWKNRIVIPEGSVSRAGGAASKQEGSGRNAWNIEPKEHDV